ncbi:gas vesicle protein GvpJ [Nocardioides sp. YIM 152315]|uniref:gas vesicle protein GvpJ n=1 Tax=Nocardioides sp. YIM 152315 TaxID=3031760 RepID=UPI0023DA74B1|nr:gas vesicle protein GvpJ [Nocardioides sp. YIM 152315]MDF1602512.1 gas vesicle protein [Nocardioides sp. YIM 152315]
MTVLDSGEQRVERQPARDLAPVALVDLLDRLLGTGVVVAGDVVVSLAGVDLVEIRLQLMISSVRAAMEQGEQGREAGSR